MSLAMTRSEREAFLADVHVGVVSIEVPDGPPLAVPIWYDFDPARGVRIITEETSQKGRALRAAGRFTLVAQTEEPPAYPWSPPTPSATAAPWRTATSARSSATPTPTPRPGRGASSSPCGPSAGAPSTTASS